MLLKSEPLPSLPRSESRAARLSAETICFFDSISEELQCFVWLNSLDEKDAVRTTVK